MCVVGASCCRAALALMHLWYTFLWISHAHPTSPHSDPLLHATLGVFPECYRCVNCEMSSYRGHFPTFLWARRSRRFGIRNLIPSLGEINLKCKREHFRNALLNCPIVKNTCQTKVCEMWYKFVHTLSEKDYKHLGCIIVRSWTLYI